MNVKQALLAGSILALPVTAAAQPITGLYVGAGAGAVLPYASPNKGITGPDGGVTNIGDGLHFNAGWVGEISVGYGFGNGLRTELEGDFNRNQLKNVTGFDSANGFENRYGAMVNVLYDIDLTAMGMSWGSFIQPYIGVGAGYQFTRWIGVYAADPAAELSVNKKTSGFAYQGILGFAVPIAPVPGLAFTVDYRIMDMPFDRKFGAAVTTPAAVIPATLKVGSTYNNMVLVGLRYALFAAPPPPPPPAPAPVAAPAPAPSRTYLVFFDWDKADLTERARQIIAEAAQNSTRVQVTRIEVNGYTDTSGLASYNQKLSVRRAQNVAAELVRDGVPENEITVQGFGETHLLVPTANGVREPQNRRVEIIFR